MLTDQNILVTGGAGFVGRTIIRRFLDRDPNVIRVFDNNEPGMARAKRSVADDRCRFLIGDIRDSDRLHRAMENIDIVVHTAAMKHVDLSEYNPFEAVKTNVVGLQNVIDAAIDASVKRFVFTSSDKAVNPANTMGTTKLLGEKLVTAGNKYRGASDIRLASVRFGNVINSSQSVVPLFLDQIKEGGPVTLTDARMTRFFITYDEICELVVKAIEKTEGGEIFIEKMPAVRIDDLAEAMIETVAPRYGLDPVDVEVKETGRRVGETLHEEIVTDREGDRAVEDETTYAVLPETVEGEFLNYEGIQGFEPVDELSRSSADAPKLSRDGIVDLLAEGGLSGLIDES